MNYYECHITLEPFYAEAAAPIAKLYGFKTSKIDGDEHLENRLWFYCTRSMKNFDDLSELMHVLCADLEASGITWKRRKIEGIIIDEMNPKPSNLFVEGVKIPGSSVQSLSTEQHEKVHGSLCAHSRYHSGLSHNDPVFVCDDCGHVL